MGKLRKGRPGGCGERLWRGLELRGGPPTKLHLLRRRIFYAAVAWMIGTPALAALLGPSPLFRALAFGGWIVVAGMTVKYLYLLFFKKDTEPGRDTF